MHYPQQVPKEVNPMSTPVPPESIAAIRSLFFGRLADANRELILALADLAPQLEGRNHNTSLAILAEIERRIGTMRNILIVFRECLED